MSPVLDPLTYAQLASTLADVRADQAADLDRRVAYAVEQQDGRLAQYLRGRAREKRADSRELRDRAAVWQERAREAASV